MKNSFMGVTRRVICFILCLVIAPQMLDVSFIETSAEDICYAEEAMRAMSEGFYAFEESIDLSRFNISPEDIGTLFSGVTKHDPYLFFVDNHLSFSYKEDGYVTSVRPRYSMSKGEAYQRVAYCREEVERASALVGKGRSQAEKALLVHDMLCLGFEYDLSLESRDLYGFFVNKKGTCQGYAWAYMAILREMGIECEFAASDSIEHIWNLVKIDGEWYHVDVTWDDPPTKNHMGGDISRRHFLCSDKRATEQGHKDWYSASGVECASQSYDGVDFNNIIHSLHVSGDIDANGNAELYDLLMMRRLVENTQVALSSFCPLCADADVDEALTESDVELLRKRLLLSPPS